MLQEAAALEVAQSATVRCISLAHETPDVRPRPAVATSATDSFEPEATLVMEGNSEWPCIAEVVTVISLVVQTLLELLLAFATGA